MEPKRKRKGKGTSTMCLHSKTKQKGIIVQICFSELMLYNLHSNTIDSIVKERDWKLE